MRTMTQDLRKTPPRTTSEQTSFGLEILACGPEACWERPVMGYVFQPDAGPAWPAGLNDRTRDVMLTPSAEAKYRWRSSSRARSNRDLAAGTDAQKKPLEDRQLLDIPQQDHVSKQLWESR